MADSAGAPNATGTASSSASSASAPLIEGPEAGAATENKSADPADSCMWYGGSMCGTPRSCFDCLNTAIESDACAIDPYGECVSASEYEAFVNRRNYYVPNYKYFPASNYTYCSADDAGCAECRSSWKGETYGTVDATYCSGADGCVCISLCEVTNYDAAVLSMQSCTVGGFAISGISSTMTRVLIAAAVGISVAMLFFGIAYVVKRHIRSLDDHNPLQFDAEGRPLARRTTERRPPRTGPLLGLNGWKSMREKLIETERSEVQGGATTLSGQPASDAAVEAPAIVIEHGEGYRPMSPSAMAGERTAPAAASAMANAPASAGPIAPGARPTSQSI